MCPRILFLPVPTRGRRRRRRKTNRRNESRAREENGSRVQKHSFIWLSYSWRTLEIRVRPQKISKTASRKLHESHFLPIFQCFDINNTHLRNSSNFVITQICAGIAQHPSHSHREITGYSSHPLYRLQMPSRLRRWEKPQWKWPGALPIYMWASVEMTVGTFLFFMLVLNTHLYHYAPTQYDTVRPWGGVCDMRTLSMKSRRCQILNRPAINKCNCVFSLKYGHSSLN